MGQERPSCPEPATMGQQTLHVPSPQNPILHSRFLFPLLDQGPAEHGSSGPEVSYRIDHRLLNPALARIK